MACRGPTRIVSLCAVVLATALPAQAASPIAQIVCAPRDEMVTRLERQFGEVRRGYGMRSPEEVMELWSSPRSGDWTLVMTYASGMACIVAMGEQWQPLPPPPA